MKTSKKIEKWLDVLNEVSGALEEHVASEEDKKLILKLDDVIDELYTFMKVLPLVEKDENND